jgi:hypothetical protein
MPSRSRKHLFNELAAEAAACQICPRMASRAAVPERAQWPVACPDHAYRRGPRAGTALTAREFPFTAMRPE